MQNRDIQRFLNHAAKFQDRINGAIRIFDDEERETLIANVKTAIDDINQKKDISMKDFQSILQTLDEKLKALVKQKEQETPPLQRHTKGYNTALSVIYKFRQFLYSLTLETRQRGKVVLEREQETRPRGKVVLEHPNKPKQDTAQPETVKKPASRKKH